MTKKVFILFAVLSLAACTVNKSGDLKFSKSAAWMTALETTDSIVKQNINTLSRQCISRYRCS